MKKFLIIVNIMLALALIAAVAAFWYVHTLLEDTPAKAIPSTSKDSSEFNGASSSAESDLQVDSTQISEEQKAALDNAGINSENFTITPAMLDCASSKLSDTRIAEIAEGDAPTVIETAKLLPCLGAE